MPAANPPARILVIDDDANIRAVLKKALSKAGYRVEVAEDGKEGVRHFRTEPTDLVLVDIFMPEKEGLETIMEIRSVAPDIKVIAMSGGGMTGSLEYLSYAESFGVSRALTKPFEIGELLAAVREVLGKD